MCLSLLSPHLIITHIRLLRRLLLDGLIWLTNGNVVCLLSRCLSFVGHTPDRDTGGNERDTAGTEVPFDMELPFRATEGHHICSQ